MGTVLACCALDAGCGLISGTGRMLFGCIPWGRAKSARIANALLFFFYCFIMFAVHHWGEDLAKLFPIIGLKCDSVCYNFYTTYRLGLALAFYHTIQAIILIGVVDPTSDQRAALQEGFWPLKLIVLFLLAIGSLFIPPSFLNFMFIPTILFGVLFLLIQAILLVDLAYSWAEDLLDGVERGERTHQIVLIGSTVLLNSIAIGLILSIYLYFNRELERTLVTVNASLIIIMTICSVLPKVQESNPSCGIFQSSLLGLYSLFILTSAFISDPSRPKDSNSIMVTFPTLGKVISIFSVIYAYLAMARAAMSVGSNLHRMAPDTEKGGDAIGDSDEEAAASHYNYSLFHVSFVMAAFYTILYITFWQYAKVEGATTTTVTIIDSALSFWSRVVSSWVVTALYLWSLFAPIILEDRAF